MSRRTRPRFPGVLVLLLLLVWSGWAVAAEAPEQPRKDERPKDPFKDRYRNYRPDFLHDVWKGRVFGRWRASKKEMRLSSEGSFFTLNQIPEDARANALVEAGVEKEQKGLYRQALQIYHKLITRYPDKLYRVSRYGVFVPVAQYAQRRLLNFPRQHLEHYRTLHDPGAREAFESARRKNSLIGLSEIVDTMLATSYGGQAIIELGNASLDTGHYLAALERFSTVRDYFPAPELRTPELGLKTALARKMLGRESKLPEPELETGLTASQLEQLRKFLAKARPEKEPFRSQKISPPHATANDYTLFPPTTDPLALKEPVWSFRLPGSRRDRFVYSQPVVTTNSVIYRHKNIVYCHSILNGELRWKFDLGGRAVWQNGTERQYPREDVLVQDGLVFTAVSKGGPSLVALDEVSGQLRWAYGPMVAATIEESRMRFETAPTGGPRTVYVGYVLDNIEGDSHTDTEYGVMAFDSTSGRIRWRRELCRLAPGKFAAGFAVRRRNRIRSFTSPPLYHQGTVYYCTNAGAVAAVEGLSGRVKWLMRYQYYPRIHDATREWRGHRQVWYNQRPLIVGERLYVPPVDSPFFLCLDRRTGAVNWSFPKPSRREGYFVGPMSTGELVFVYSGRGRKNRMFHTGGGSTHAVHVLDPKTGEPVWRLKDLMKPIDTPVLRHYIFGSPAWCAINRRWTSTPTRPCLTRDDKLFVTPYCDVSVWYRRGMVVYFLSELDLRERKLTHYRRYYTGELLAHCAAVMYGGGRESAPNDLEAHEELPHKDKRVKRRIQVMKEMINGPMPENKHGPFKAFIRVTARRYGAPVELRFGPQDVEMMYDRSAVRAALKGKRDTAADFARAELAVGRSRYAEAADLLKRCLRTISSEDLDFRSLINQQLYKVHKRLCRSAIRARDKDAELANALGMARTAGTLADEIETLLALSEAYERRGDAENAARCLRSIISTYGHHEYPVASAAVSQPDDLMKTAHDVLDGISEYAGNPVYGDEFARALTLTRRGLPLYLSTVSPLPKDLTVRAGELAARKLSRLQRDKTFAAGYDRLAREELVGRTPDEQLYRLWEFPGTGPAQTVLDRLFEAATERPAGERKRLMWRLADVARVCRLDVPEAYRADVLAPPPTRAIRPVTVPQTPRSVDLAEEEGINWLVLERRDDRSTHRNRLFLGGRVRKRLDNKFILACFDLATGEELWRKERVRLKGTGQEPGFFHAYVLGDLVVVHGLYDVLAFEVKTAELAWRYRVPFDFEIKHSTMSGDLLVLCGSTETIALRIPATSEAGEVAWQVQELGDLYAPSYFVGDRLISVRKNPFNVTGRFRATGKLIGRLDLPDLSLHTRHPLLEKGPEALPHAHAGRLLALTDTWYYIVVDVERLAIVWKRLIDNNDLSRQPALRFALSEEYLAVLKEDYDVKALYMLSAKTGEVLWHTDPKDAESPQPMHSMHIDGGRVYGIGVHPGQGFYVVCRDCRSGKQTFGHLTKGYDAKPSVVMIPRLYGERLALTVKDRQQFELRVYDSETGQPLHKIGGKASGEFGVHGRVSATVQDGRLVLLTKDKLKL